jgi:CheY-like chemotaxis protein
MPLPPDAPRLTRVLLIDDDMVTREVLAMMIEMSGFPVACAEDGSEALAMLQSVGQDESFPDVILMDTQMPGLSGLPLVAALRENCAARGTRIIAISGSQVDASIREASDGFLLKPVETEALVAMLNRTEAETLDSSQAGGDAHAPSSSESLIDPVVLANLKAMMPVSSVREIYAAVAADLATRLKKLQAAVAAGDREEVARIGHAIKGGCAMTGLTGARDAASRLETSNDTESWAGPCEYLQSTLHALEGMLLDDFPV